VLKLNDELTGVVFKKAEQEKNFVGVYTAVFQRMHELENEEDMVLILGDVGG
jgi:hypothetical protein